MLARHGGDEFLILLPDLGRRRRGGRARGGRRGRRRGSPSRSRSPAPSSTSTPASASRCSPTTPTGAGRAAPARRHGDVPEQGPRAGGLDRLRARRPRPARAAVAAGAAAARDRRATSSSCTTSRSSGLQTGRLHSMEALLRWNDPERGLVLPRRLHPRRRGDEPARADRRLGDRRARPADPRLARAGPAAARVASTSRRASCTGPTSAPSWPRGWRDARDRPGAADDGADRVGHPARARADRPAPARAAARPGCRLAIDDFGAGWSSLSRLRLLPVQIAQDRPLVPARDPRRPGSRARSCARSSRSSDALGMTTVAEGVETRVQQLFLAAQGCPLAQGRFSATRCPRRR